MKNDKERYSKSIEGPSMQCNVLYCFAKTARHDHHFALSGVLGAK